jgi:hypothetical protein
LFKSVTTLYLCGCIAGIVFKQKRHSPSEKIPAKVVIKVQREGRVLNSLEKYTDFEILGIHAVLSPGSKAIKQGC